MYKFKDGGIIFDNEEELVNLCTGIAVKAARTVVDRYADSIKNLKENFDDVKKSLKDMERKIEERNEPEEKEEEEEVNTIHIDSSVKNTETEVRITVELLMLIYGLMVKNSKLKAILEENGLEVEEGE